MRALTHTPSRTILAEAAVLLLFAGVLVASFFAVKDATYFGDEGFHFEQIELFLKGELRNTGAVTTIPGHHAFLALLSVLTGLRSLLFYRAVTLCLGILSVFVFHDIARRLEPRTALVRTAQYVFLPILFPFFFLLYTDVPSVLLSLLALRSLLRRRYAGSALWGILSITVRQNNIIWLGFLFALFLWREYGRTLLRPLPSALRRRLTPYLPAAQPPLGRFRLAAGWFWFLLGFVLFAAFVVWNGGIAIGDKGAHPFPNLHLGNVYFLLFLLFFFFLPLHLFRMKEAAARLRTSRMLMPLLVVAFVVYMFTFVNTHGYNQDLYSVFLRNRILVYFNLSLLLKTAFFLPVGFALLSLAASPRKRTEFLLLLPLTVLYLLPSWLIEQRYYFVPFVFFLLFRAGLSRRQEWAQAAYSVLFTGVIYYIVATRYLFL
ncbi:MAG: hypothetical protein PHW10_02125 [Candidatus Peribacteraceae bacterium]|nr:hypothetical protein [Candidatus Peribacteraceae bacterium]